MAPEEHLEGAVSSLTVPKEGEEGEQQQIDQKDLLEEQKGQVMKNCRIPKAGSGKGGRHRNWRKTKVRERLPKKKRKQRDIPGDGRKTPS